MNGIDTIIYLVGFFLIGGALFQSIKEDKHDVKGSKKNRNSRRNKKFMFYTKKHRK